jgi:hypothetical protein
MDVVHEPGMQRCVPDGYESGVRGVEGLIRRRARHEERQRDQGKGGRSGRVTPEPFLHLVFTSEWSYVESGRPLFSAAPQDLDVPDALIRRCGVQPGGDPAVSGAAPAIR